MAFPPQAALIKRPRRTGRRCCGEAPPAIDAAASCEGPGGVARHLVGCRLCSRVERAHTIHERQIIKGEWVTNFSRPTQSTLSLSWKRSHAIPVAACTARHACTRASCSLDGAPLPVARRPRTQPANVNPGHLRTHCRPSSTRNRETGVKLKATPFLLLDHVLLFVLA